MGKVHHVDFRRRNRPDGPRPPGLGPGVAAVLGFVGAVGVATALGLFLALGSLAANALGVLAGVGVYALLTLRA